MPTADKLPLTSAEIANLWTVYMADTLMVSFKKHLVAKAEDEQIRALLRHAITISDKSTRDIVAIFRSSNVSIPVGFSDKDVIMEAPRLFSDSFALYHTLLRTRWAMTIMAPAFFLAARPDVRKFFQGRITDAMKLNEEATQVALEKGLFLRPPIVSIPQTPHMVEKPSYIGSVFGEPRPLHVVSVTHLFLSVLANMVGKVLTTGFSQVARDPEVRKFCLRGAEISAKHIKVFSSLLSDENVPMPASPDSMLTSSTLAPFSDKLMMNHVILINTFALTDIGLAAGQSTRADIAADYFRIGAEVVQYGEDGINILIKNGWMEAPPQVVNHRELALSGSK